MEMKDVVDSLLTLERISMLKNSMGESLDSNLGEGNRGGWSFTDLRTHLFMLCTYSAVMCKCNTYGYLFRSQHYP